jgi:acetyl esterase/lipase
MAPSWNKTTLEIKSAHQVPVEYSVGFRLPLILHFHGGSFLSGSAGHESPVRSLLAELGYTVVSVAYPLASAAPFPAALRAAHDALVPLAEANSRSHDPPAPIVVCGEDAGDNLAAALCHLNRDRLGPETAAALLISPMLDPRCATASQRLHQDRASGALIARGWKRYLQEPADFLNTYAAPGVAKRLTGLPHHLIVTSIDDAHRDESVSYGAKLLNTGVTTRTSLVPYAADWPVALHAGAVPGGLGQLLAQTIGAFFGSVSQLWPDLCVAGPGKEGTAQTIESSYSAGFPRSLSRWGCCRSGATAL